MIGYVGMVGFRFPLLLALIGALLQQPVVGTGRRRKNGVVNARHITIHNQSGAKVDVFWIHPETRELGASNTEDKGIMYGASTGIASFVTHAFEIQEMAPCKNTRCRKGYFSVSNNEDQG